MGVFLRRLTAASLAALLFWSPLVSSQARAQDDAPRERFLDTATDGHVDELESATSAAEDTLQSELRDELAGSELTGETAEALEQAAEAEPQVEPEAQQEAQPLALPTGPAKSGVTPQTIALPQGEGSIQGMGESFTPQLSSGTGTFSVPIALPKGRNGVGPSLALSYSTSGGNGPLGVGWSVGAPFISRQTDKGLPRYVDAELHVHRRSGARAGRLGRGDGRRRRAGSRLRGHLAAISNARRGRVHALLSRARLVALDRAEQGRHALRARCLHGCAGTL
jgi:hypothetical protein